MTRRTRTRSTWTRRIRPLLAAAAFAGLLGTGAVVLPSVVAAAPAASAKPTIPQVQAKLATLRRQSEALDEQYNKAAADVTAKLKAAQTAQHQAQQAAASFAHAGIQLRQTVLSEYESPSFSSAGALLDSQNGQTYLDTLNMLSLISSHRADVVQQISALHAHAVATQRTAAQLLAAAKAKATALAKQKTQLQAQTTKFTALLATLTAQQRAEIERQQEEQAAAARAELAKAQAAAAAAAAAAAQSSSSSSGSSSSGSSSGTSASTQGVSSRIQKVINYAIAQVGKSYVFAGTGPDSFDCSGLTMMAYEQVGISLPHQSSEQYNYGTHVSSDDLQPGDLVFLYPPDISHVEIMVGPDLAVSAADPAEGVRYVHPSQDMGDYAGATRIL